MIAELLWFDMDGSRISTDEYCARLKADPKWRRVARTEVGQRYVSTVLLGLDHGHGAGPPIIFESMSFPDCDRCERYSTREQAVAGHAAMVAQLEAEDAKARGAA